MSRNLEKVKLSLRGMMNIFSSIILTALRNNLAVVITEIASRCLARSNTALQEIAAEKRCSGSCITQTHRYQTREQKCLLSTARCQQRSVPTVLRGHGTAPSSNATMPKAGC